MTISRRHQAWPRRPGSRLETGVTMGPEITMETSASGTWLVDSPRSWRTASMTQLEAVHVALGEVAAAGVERQPPVGASRLSDREEVVGLLGGEEAVLDQAHEDAAGEVLVALHHVDVLGRDAGHLVELRGHRGEARRGVERRVVAAGGVAVLEPWAAPRR